MTTPSRIACTLRALLLLVAGTGLAIAPGCGGGGGGGGIDPFEVQRTDFAVTQTPGIALAGQWMAFLANENATNDPLSGAPRDLSGDGVADDLAPVVVDMASGDQYPLAIEADAVAIAGDLIFIVTDEADGGEDFDMDGSADDLVLHYWLASLGGAPIFVDTLDPAATTPVLAVGNLLYYTALPTVAPGGGESTLRYVAAVSPINSAPVLTRDTTNGLRPHILGADGGLLFLTLDEEDDDLDLNGDSDDDDEHVLALLDTSSGNNLIRNVGLAVRDDSAPFSAYPLTGGSFLVGFLVNEEDQDDTNFNSPSSPDLGPAWQPGHCAGEEDTDTLDDVLHFLYFGLWDADPVANPPRNTGLVGSDRIVAVNGYVGTVSQEADQGTCDLNSDGDSPPDDDVVRWTAAPTNTSLLIEPVNDATLMLALADVSGGVHGFGAQKDRQMIEDRLVILVDEAAQGEDIDGDPDDHWLVGWIDPGNPVAWQFDHLHTSDRAFIGASWMGEAVDSDYLLWAEEEIPFDFADDPDPPDFNNDGDSDDTIAAFSCFGCSSGQDDDLDFPAVANAYALDQGSAGPGIVLAAEILFYRVDEAQDSRDLNNDGDMVDILLLSTGAGIDRLFGNLNTIVDSPAVITDGLNGAAFIAPEGAVGLDLNGDGDTNDLDVSWFRIN